MNTGGSHIHYYVINVSSNNDADFKCIEKQCEVNANSSMVTGLKHAVTYDISISAVNCIGVGESSSTLQLRTGKSPIIVYSADPPFSALNSTSIKIFWNTITNASSESVRKYLILLIDEVNMRKETFFTTKQEYTIGNILISPGIKCNFAAYKKTGSKYVTSVPLSHAFLKCEKMSTAFELKYCSRINSEIRQNLSCINSKKTIYPTGSNLVLFDVENHVQKFLPLNNKGGTVMTVSSNKHYLAIAEKQRHLPTITIFDLQTLRKRKVLTCPEANANIFVSLSFSEKNSKYLVAQGDGPEWVLVYWNWKKAKVVASTKVCWLHDNTVCQVSINPKHNTLICAVGEKLFKLFSYSQGTLRQLAWSKANPQNYLCHTWLSENRILLGTDAGKLQLFEMTELKNEFFVNETARLMSSRSQQEYDILSDHSHHIFAILPYSRGFICSSGPGQIHFFRKTKDRNIFNKLKAVSISSNDVERTPNDTGNGNNTISS